MTDRIEPVLTAEEWASQRVGRAAVGGPAVAWNHHGVQRGVLELTPLAAEGTLYLEDGNTENGLAIAPDAAPAAIALLNHLLPDGDSRKITRETVNALRSWIVPCNNHAGFRQLAVLLHHHAEALASYLPPEGP